MIDPVYIPEQWNDRTMMQVRDGEIMLYRKAPDFAERTAESLEKQKQVMLLAKQGTEKKPGAYSGSMTVGARKRMVKAVTLLCQAAKPKWITNEVTGRMHLHRLSFLTLTVSSNKNLTAKECYEKILKHFLQWLRRTKGITHYVWKAELQQRGQIHYHFIFPNFIHYREIRMKWNSLQREAGLLDEYVRKHKHADPNSTDIHEMKNVVKVAKYVVKELGKDIDANKLRIKKQIQADRLAGLLSEQDALDLLDQLEENRFFTDGKVWDCSDNLSSMNYFTMPLSPSQDIKIRELLTRKKASALFGEWWSVIDIQGNSPPTNGRYNPPAYLSILSRSERKAFETHISIVKMGGKKYLKEIQLFNN